MNPKVRFMQRGSSADDYWLNDTNFQMTSYKRGWLDKHTMMTGGVNERRRRQTIKQNRNKGKQLEVYITHFGTRIFTLAGPKAWNQLLIHIRAWETARPRRHWRHISSSPLSWLSTNCAGTSHPCSDCFMLPCVRNCYPYLLRASQGAVMTVCRLPSITRL